MGFANVAADKMKPYLEKLATAPDLRWSEGANLFYHNADRSAAKLYDTCPFERGSAIQISFKY